MNLIPIIKDALMPLAPTYHLSSSRDVPDPTYISFFEYHRQSEFGADNNTAIFGRYWQIDVWSRELDDDDLFSLEQQAESALVNAGFCDFSVQDLYEADTEIAHYAIRCYLLEEVTTDGI